MRSEELFKGSCGVVLMAMVSFAMMVGVSVGIIIYLIWELFNYFQE